MRPHATKLSLVQKFEKDSRVSRSYRYSFWHVQGVDPDGQRIRKKFAAREAALDWKNLKEIELTNGSRKLHSIITGLSDQQIKEAETCFGRLGGRYTLTQSVDFFLQHFHEPDFKISLSDAIVSFRGAQEGQVRDRTGIQLKSTLGQFEKFLDNCGLHEITTVDVERFLRSLRARDGVNPASRKTWNNYRGDLHLFFEWCCDKQRRWLASNPAADTTRFKIEREHIEVLSLDRARELMDYVAGFKDGKYTRYFALALFAGVRPGGELEKLDPHPELVDLSNKVVRITAAISKTGKPRQIKIRPNLREWLSKYPEEILPVNCDRELKAIRKQFALSHDILRHTFISMHVGAFKAFADAALESGNSEKIIRDHYLNTSTAGDAKTFWKMVPAQNGK